MRRTSIIIGLYGGALLLGVWWFGWKPFGPPATAPSNVVVERGLHPDDDAIIGVLASEPSAPGGDNRGDDSSRKLSPVVLRLLEDGSRFPRTAQLESLTTNDVAALVAAYGRTESITNKIAIAWTLAFVGDKDGFELLSNSLVRDYQGCHFDHPREPATLNELPWFMGMLADVDPRALAFLRNGVEPKFWRARVGWAGPGSDPAVALARSAIRGLAASGHPEAWQTVLNLVSNPPPWFSPADSTTFVMAACYHDMVVTRGKGWVWDNLPGNFEFFREWRNTDAGRPWREWQDEKRKGWLP